MLNSSFFPVIDPQDFSYVTNKLREFFLRRGYKEAHTQNIISILAACEDPFNISTFNYQGKTWPLPQTGQMNLEHFLLKQPELPGLFCVSTSYRNEKQPIEGRHCLVFPMFEFEFHGDMNDLYQMELELLTYLGFTTKMTGEYLSIANEYGVKIIDNDVEGKLCTENNVSAFMLTHFPEYTNPFWNMKRNENDTAQKIDVILHGQETIGSAERSCDKEQMRSTFFSIEDGRYAEKLFDLFGYTRVLDELNKFLSNEFIPRVGGGIGITRLIRAMKLEGLM